ncbi:MAG: GTP-binding protein [Promethearchaeota archaeon]|jgi:small GTP-binding protein
MGLLRKWRKQRKLRSIPSELIFESLYSRLKSFNDDIPITSKVSKRKYPRKVEIGKKLKKVKDIIYMSHYDSSNENILMKGKSPMIRDITNRLYGVYDFVFKIVLFGDPNTGKDILVQRFLTNLFKSDSKLNIGVDFEVKNLKIDKRKIKLHIWDFGGEERFRFLYPTYLRGANGALFIYNVNDFNSIAHLDDWLMTIRSEFRQEKQIPIVVAGIVLNLEEERQITSDQGIKIAQSRGVNGFVECSPITGENVEETFEGLTKLILAKSGN